MLRLWHQFSMDSLRLQITRKMQYIVGSLRKIITCVRANVATMGHLNIITYNSKAATTSQLKFGVHKQLSIGAGYGYFLVIYVLVLYEPSRTSQAQSTSKTGALTGL